MENKESYMETIEENEKLRGLIANNLKYKKLKRTLIVAVVLVVVVIAAILGTYIAANKSAETKYQAEVERLQNELENSVLISEEISAEVNLNVINTEIKEIGELATVEYLYTDAGKFTDQKQIFGYDISLTTKSFITKWDGIIKAGIDVNGITTELNEEEKVLTVYIPKAEILSHEIDEDSVETLDESDGLFNPVKVEDVRAFDAESKKTMEERAIENGLLEKAQENAEVVITKLLYADPVLKEHYTIEFEVK